MALSHVPVTPGTGANIAGDDVGSDFAQCIKILLGGVGVDGGFVSTSNKLPVVGPATDAEMRATPIPISGTVTATGGLTDTQLRATPVPVSGPLTDTQLRATAVPISAATLPLPSGAATQVTLASIDTTLSNSDSTLNDILTALGSLAEQGTLAQLEGFIEDVFVDNGGSQAGHGLAIAGNDGFNARVLKVRSGGELLVDGSGFTQPISGTVSITANSTVDVAKINGVTPLMGNGGTGTGSPRVTIANDNTVLPGLGAGATGSAIPANAVLQGLSDGTNLRARLQAANALNSTGTGLATAQIVGQFDDTSPTSITENQFGNLRMSANRNLYGTIRDAAGNERGVNVNTNNQLSISLDAIAAALTLATVTTVSTVTNLSQLGGTAISMNSGTRDAGTQRITIATNDVVPVVGGRTNDNAVPGATNVGVLPAVANAAAPTRNEGNLGALRTTLSGDLAITLDGEVISANNSDPAATTGSITAVDAVSATTTNASGQSIITGTPTAGSAVSVAITGHDTATLMLSGTANTTCVFERSMDGGTTWLTFSMDLLSLGTAASSLAMSDNKAYILRQNVGGITNVRVRCTTYGSGTVTVRWLPSWGLGQLTVNQGMAASITNRWQVGLSDGTTSAAVIAAINSLKTDLSSIAGTITSVNSGNKDAGTQRFVLATDQPALTNKLLVTPDANSTVDLAKIGGTTIVNGGVAGSQSVGGTVATNVAITDNPINTGGQAISSENAAVTTARKVQFVADLVGKQIIQLYANPENFVSGTISSAMTGTTTTSLVAAPAAGLRNYITTFIVSNSSAAIGTDIIIQDGSGGTTLAVIPAAAGYGGAAITLPTPLRQPTTGTAIFCANVTTGSSTKVTAIGWKGA